MKKILTIILTLMLISAMALTLGSCGSKDGETEPEETQTEQTETEETEEPEAAEVVKTISDIDTEDMHDMPLQIESVTLFDDGSVMLVPLEDLKKNAETNDELDENGAMYPFADSGKAKDIYLVRFGNGGYRTIIALMDDGTLSALSAKELIEDQIAVVMPNVSGRDNFVSVEQKEYEDGFGVVGKTEDGEEVELDFSLDF